MLYRPYHFPPLDLVQADSLQQTSAPAGERDAPASPVPLKAKIIMIGSPLIYQLLFHLEHKRLLYLMVLQIALI